MELSHSIFCKISWKLPGLKLFDLYLFKLQRLTNRKKCIAAYNYPPWYSTGILLYFFTFIQIDDQACLIYFDNDKHANDLYRLQRLEELMFVI